MADPSGTGTTVTLVVPARPGTPTTVVPPARPLPHHHLPFTGFDVLGALIVAALLLALGAVLLVTTRRSATPTSHPAPAQDAAPHRRTA